MGPMEHEGHTSESRVEATVKRTTRNETRQVMLHPGILIGVILVDGSVAWKVLFSI